LVSKEESRIKALVEEIINHWDPIELLPYAPKDEYEMEITNIVEILAETQDTFALASEIKQIFTKSFGDDLFSRSMDECVAIAASIIKLI